MNHFPFNMMKSIIRDKKKKLFRERVLLFGVLCQLLLSPPVAITNIIWLVLEDKALLCLG